MKRFIFLFALAAMLSGTVQSALAMGELYSTISVGIRHALALKQDGTVWAWGDNQNGSIGDGTKEFRKEPVQVLSGAVAVSAGASSSMAITEDGTLWAWGWGKFSQLGLGNSEDIFTPTKVMTDVVAVSAGHFDGCAIKKDGSLWVWGWNQSQAIRRSAGISHEKPIKVPGLKNVVMAVALGNGCAALTKEGDLWAWVITSMPKKILSNVREIATTPNGGGTALDVNGIYWTFNGDGEPTRSNRSMPNVKSFVYDSETFFSLTNDNILVGSGTNFGQFGGKRHRKVRNETLLDDVVAFSYHSSTTLMLRSDGSLWLCGDAFQSRNADAEALVIYEEPTKIMDGVMLPKPATE